MTANVYRTDRDEIKTLIYQTLNVTLSPIDKLMFADCVDNSTSLWVGYLDNEFICGWGLMPFTLMSDRAYLWLHCTEKVNEHKFLFIRRSQLAVEEMLKTYPNIVGHVAIDNHLARRWLEWLGATIIDTNEHGFNPFVITKSYVRDNG